MKRKNMYPGLRVIVKKTKDPLTVVSPYCTVCDTCGGATYKDNWGGIYYYLPKYLKFENKKRDKL